MEETKAQKKQITLLSHPPAPAQAEYPTSH